MEKVKLNNQVVSMRKYVKQAKVHIINKLVKEVKLLQNRKGNEVQVQKAKRKAERFLEEIALIKKTKPDDVSKLALSKSKNWKNVLLQKNSSLNDRCIAMLASYEAVKKEVEQFYSSNQQLASKISDLIKQWEDKNKHTIKSPKVKNILNKTEKSNKNVQKASKDEYKNQLNKKSKLDIETNSQSVNENENSSVTDNHEMKNESSSETISTENKIPITETSNDDEQYEPSGDDEKDDIIQNNPTIKKSVTESGNADEEIVNSTNTDNSDNDSESASDIDQSDVNSHLKEKMQTKKLHDVSDQGKDMVENSDNDENAMEIENTINSEDAEDGDSESVTDAAETININDKVDAEKQDSNVLEYIKKMNNSEKKLKAITLLKLDELDGLDEIPINKNDKDESSESEEESSEKEMDMTQSKRNDPFFLGCGDDYAMDENVEGSSKNEKYGPKKTFISNDGPQRRNNKFSKRKETSNYFSDKRQCETFSHSNKFQKSDTSRQKFRSRDNHDKFQLKNKNNFRNQKNFKAKNEHSFSHGKKRLDNKSNSLYKRNNKDNYSFSPKGLTKEGKANDKGLHPSWEAKRKQKEVVNTFQGKRIVFDD